VSTVIYEVLSERIRSNQPVALATVVDGPHVGAKLLVTAGEEPIGDLGDPELTRIVARDAIAELEAAFLIDASAVRAQMAEVLWAHAELAEAERDPDRLGDLLRRLETYDAARARAWSRPGELVLSLDRPGRISVHAFRPGAPGPTIAGGFDAQPVVERAGAHLEAALPPGSYVSVIAMPDGHVVRDPFLLGRGERLERTLVVPPQRAVPPGFVWVPAGRFLYGSARDDDFRRDFLKAPPLHSRPSEAFWIARTEVTYEEWLTYLRALPPLERAARQTTGEGVALVEKNGRFALWLVPAAGNEHRVTEGEPLTYQGRRVHQHVRWERLPVSGISYDDARAYTAWLDRTGRVPGARVCRRVEWERAARGADGRSFPHGETLRPGDANFDETYGQLAVALGPDEVGSFPASDSPFAVVDMVGNVWEWTADEDGAPWYKGGGYYQERINALTSNANHAEPSQRNVRIGLRVCADAARAR
jgi:formylglycine-generating enzyme required for sulfatase activity